MFVEASVLVDQNLIFPFYLPPGSPEGDYNLHHVRVYVCACVRACVRACVCHAVFSETTTVTHFW